MKLFVLAVAALLAACGSDPVTPGVVTLANSWCESHEGLRTVALTRYSATTYVVRVVCKDETRIERVFSGKP